MTAATVERALALVGGVAEGLRDVGRRVDFIDNDVHEVRDLAAEADIVHWRLKQLWPGLLGDSSTSSSQTRRFGERTQS